MTRYFVAVAMLLAVSAQAQDRPPEDQIIAAEEFGADTISAIAACGDKRGIEWMSNFIGAYKLAEAALGDVALAARAHQAWLSEWKNVAIPNLRHYPAVWCATYLMKPLSDAADQIAAGTISPWDAPR